MSAQPHYEDASNDEYPELFYAPVALDTEGSVKEPWGLSFSCFPDTGYVLRSGSVGLTAVLGYDFNALGNQEITLHNALHDLSVLRALGIDLQPGQYTDTMLMAYLLGEEFVGLKKLASKYLGKHRQGYRDVMEEANERIGRAWLESTLADFPRFPGAKPPDLEKKLRLVERMLKKHDEEIVYAPGVVPELGDKATLRSKWATCVAREYLEDEEGLIGEMPEASLNDVKDPQAAVAYACEDADDTGQLRPLLEARIIANDLVDVLNADLAILPMLDRMQTVGMRANKQYFIDLRVFFQAEWDQWQAELDAFAGYPVNVKSSKDVPKFLLACGMRGGKKTEGGSLATGDKILEAARKHPRTSEKIKRGIELIQEIREIRTLKSSFCDEMPGYITDAGRLHPRLKNTATDTGRLAAHKPNLLAFPKHSARGMLIRGGFEASEGCLLGEWDLDQIEMRVMAIDACDDVMIAEFLSGVDKHTSTASMIFGKPIDQIDKDVERFAAKAVNFGILMGITEFGLLDQFKKNGSYRRMEQRWNPIREVLEDVRVDWTEADCRQLLEDWHLAYPQASAYIQAKHAEARRYGYVKDLWGRKRWLEDINADNPYFRAAAERQAQATPIQSGAQGLTKRWMWEVWKRLPSLHAKGIYCEPLLQVHDAIILEYTDTAHADVNAVMLDALSELQMFAIPISCKGKSGLRWSDL